MSAGWNAIPSCGRSASSSLYAAMNPAGAAGEISSLRRPILPFPVTLALSPTCAVAWLENATAGANVTGRLELWATVLTHRGRTGLAAAPAMIDAGSIDSSSVRFEGRTLYWVRDHEQHRQALH